MAQSGRLVAALGAALVARSGGARGRPRDGHRRRRGRRPRADVAGRKAKMDLVALAGFRAVRITETWAPGDRPPSRRPTRRSCRNVDRRRRSSTGMEVLTTVINAGSATTPLTRGPARRLRRFRRLDRPADPALHAVIVGNEPNLNRYWLPQFNPDGSDAAAPAYETLLAQTYDALKAAKPDVDVIGGARLAARQRQPERRGRTHSPTALHRRPRRRLPGQRPHDADHGHVRVPSVRGRLERRRRRRRASELDHDRARRLREARRAVGTAFDGTAQRRLDAADRLRRVRRRVADPGRRSRASTPAPSRRRRSRSTRRPGAYYREAIPLAFCQPNVSGSSSSTRSTRRPSRAGSRASSTPTARRRRAWRRCAGVDGQSRRGVVAACPGLRLTTEGGGRRSPARH